MAEDISRLFREDVREKKRARGGQAVAKVRPKQVITPADFSFYPRRWGLTAPAIVHVDVETGEITVFRWPFERYAKRVGDVEQ